MFQKRSFGLFLIVGGINTVFGYLVFALLTLTGLHYSLAAFLATVIGVIFNFFTTGRIVFENRSPALIFRFFLGYGVYYVLYVISIGLLKHFGLDSLVAAAIALPPLSVVSYLLNKYFVFPQANGNPG
ncbi:MAG: GtrA family protein [Leptospirales bacterium]|nr:GtrA family protein [Leptospirales bacterium]